MILKSSVLRARMLKEWRAWVSRIARVVEELVPSSEVYVIGSVVRGDYVGGSDVDILIVSKHVPEDLRGRGVVKALIEERANLPYYHPFEIHVLRPEEVEYYIRRAGSAVVRVK